MTISEFLVLARSRDILDDATFQRLERLRADLKEGGEASYSTLEASLDSPRALEDEAAVESSEAPRFLRGFHDILITIGIVVLLLGLGALVNFLVALPVIIVLAEWFVRQQRLAFPAFTLTIMLAAIVGLFAPQIDDSDPITELATRFGWQFAALGLFYWRYRVPVALALMLVSLFAFGYFVVIDLMGAGADTFGASFGQNTRLYGAVGLVFAVALFSLAMQFDLADRLRVTRRSDVAFWLHLAAAPALLYAIFAALLGSEGFVFSGDKTLEKSLAVIGIVILLMFIGIIIDRRAFVTAGLISLGVAIYIVAEQIGIAISSVGAFSAVGVGIVVLLLGSGWQTLRGFFLAGLPETVRDRLPPIHK